MIVAGPCPDCQEGQIGYRLCANRETVTLLCENCAMVWTHPQKLTADDARDPLNPEFARRHPDVQLRSSRWANKEEIARWGWGGYIFDPDDLLKPPPAEN